MRINDNGIERDMTPEEQAAHEAWQVTAQAETAAIVAAADARAAALASARAKLAALGLTDDEIGAFLG